MGVINMSVTKVIEEILVKKNVSKMEFAESIGITKQNLSNKFKRDNFSALELVEMADALGMELILRQSTNKSLKEGEYLLDYPEEEKGKAKRKMTEKAKQAAVEKSRETKAKHNV